MLQSTNQKNRKQLTLLKYPRYTVWEYGIKESVDQIILPPVNRQLKFIELLENYQQHSFTPIEVKLLIRLFNNNDTFNGCVSKWKVVGVYSDLSTF